MSRPSLIAQPINHLLVLSFVLVSLIPVTLLGIKVYDAAWESAWREIHEKHRLLAMNMASPIRIYIEDKRRMMGIMSNHIAGALRTGQKDEQIHEILVNAQTHLEDFSNLSLVDIKGNTLYLLRSHAPEDPSFDNYKDAYRNNTSFKKAMDTGEWNISDLEKSPITNSPTLFLAYPVSVNNELHAVLMGELKLDQIESLRKNIHFGEKGHSAIVDNTGKALAHPNAAWAKEMKDLSHVHIVQKMLAGKTGVTEFYSPFVKLTMVAGYTSVPELGWGIMVPQPKPEVEHEVRKLIYGQLQWGLLGLLVAVILGFVMVHWITNPIYALAKSANNLLGNNLNGELPDVSKNAPKELQELNKVLKKLVSNLQKSRVETESLNNSLQQRIEEATSEIKDAYEQVRIHAIEAKHASETKSEFLASMSHELRTPLNAIIGYTELILEESELDGGNAYSKDLYRIRASGQHLLELINNILDLSKIEAGKHELNATEFTIKTLIDDIEHTIKPLTFKNGNTCTVNYEDDINSAYTDQTKLYQIILNLVSNANKFTKDGNIDINVTRLLEKEIDWLVVTIKDTGIGIAEDHINDLFNAFSQAEKDICVKFGGTGLGLSLSKSLAKMLGGNIEVESVLGEGSTFRVRIPIRIHSAAA